MEQLQALKVIQEWPESRSVVGFTTVDSLVQVRYLQLPGGVVCVRNAEPIQFQYSDHLMMVVVPQNRLDKRFFALKGTATITPEVYDTWQVKQVDRMPERADLEEIFSVVSV